MAQYNIANQAVTKENFDPAEHNLVVILTNDLIEQRERLFADGWADMLRAAVNNGKTVVVIVLDNRSEDMCMPSGLTYTRLAINKSDLAEALANLKTEPEKTIYIATDHTVINSLAASKLQYIDPETIVDWRQGIRNPLLFLSGEARTDYLALAAALPKDGKLAVAFSGGVDSSLLLYVADRVLGGQNATGILGISPFTPRREIQAALSMSKSYGLALSTASFSDTEMRTLYPNPEDRCYHCKKMLFSNFIDFAVKHGFPYLAEGSNLDDMGDYRPGLKAIAELHVLSPLRVAQFDKKKIRSLSAALGLPTKNMPSLACLATRMPYNHMIDPAILGKVDLAEEFLLNRGFKQVRVRVHGDLARIELAPAELTSLLTNSDLRLEINQYLCGLGFNYVTLDIIGYRTGSMNLNVNSVNRK